MEPITWNDFEKVELRVGTIISVEEFPEAINPSYKIKVDLGKQLGIKKSSAQITDLYTKSQLIDKQVIVVTNLKSKKLGPFISECLITGFYNIKSEVTLSKIDKMVPDGTLLM